MKQMEIPAEMIVDVELSGPAQLLNPVVFKEDNEYCCLLGEDPTVGVFGCGKTPEDALADWDKALKEHLATAGNDDEVVKHVKSAIDNQPKPKHIQEFYDQFRPLKK